MLPAKHILYTLKAIYYLIFHQMHALSFKLPSTVCLEHKDIVTIYKADNVRIELNLIIIPLEDLNQL